MRSHTATHREDTLCNGHTAQVFRRCLDTYKDNFFLLFSPCLCIVSGEYHLTGSCTGRCGKTFGNNFGSLECGLVEYRVEKLVEFLRFHTEKCSLLVDFTGTKEIHGNLHHSGTCTFTVTSLEHPELAVLNRELHILHIFVIVFETVCNCYELGSTVGHRLFEGRIFGTALLFGNTLKGSPSAGTFDSDLLRSTDAGNDVFTLSVDKVFTVEKVFTRSSITAESHTCCGVIAHVAIYHGLYVYSGTPFFRNLIHAAIYNRTFIHPAVKYGTYTAPELFPCRFGEIFAGEILDGFLKANYEFLEIVYVKFVVIYNTFFLLNVFHDGFKGVDVGFADGFHTEHYVAVHLHETAIAVPSEARIAAFLCHSSDSSVVHTEVKNRIHHTGHRCTGTGTNRN